MTGCCASSGAVRGRKPGRGKDAPPGAAQRPRREPGPLGLSLYNKSDAPQPRTLVLDNRETRLQRMKRGVLTFARLMVDQWQHRRHLVLMVTLTYRPGVEWKPRHIVRYTDALTKWLERRGSDGCYLWVMETTKAGVPHYHVMVWMSRGLFMPKADKRGWWPHGMTKTEVARMPVGYMAKYASKGAFDDKALPKRARIAGGGGLQPGARRERSWWLLPAYARSAFDISDAAIRAAGGGFISRRTGLHVASEWQLLAVGRSKIRLIYTGPPDLVRDVPESDVVSCTRPVGVDVRDVLS